MKFKKTKALLPEYLKQGAIIVDVRSAAEFNQGVRPGSVNIPVNELNNRHKELDKNEIIILCCASGTRSGVAVGIFFLMALILSLKSYAGSVSVQVSDPSLNVNWDEFIVFADKCDTKIKPVNIDIEQLNCQYSPFISVSTINSFVHIKNGDTIKHNAFALSPNNFDLGAQKPKETGKIELGGAGITKIQCRFHPGMVAQILVLKNNCYSKLKNGSAVIENVTSGENTMRLWSPHLPKVQIIPVKSAKMLFTINEKDLSRVELKKACPIDADTSAY